MVDCAYRLHVEAGPGLLESVYEPMLAKMLEQRSANRSAIVAQTFKSAVSRVCKPETLPNRHSLPIWKSATQQVWKPALRLRVNKSSF